MRSFLRNSENSVVLSTSRLWRHLYQKLSLPWSPVISRSTAGFVKMVIRALRYYELLYRCRSEVCNGTVLLEKKRTTPKDSSPFCKCTVKSNERRLQTEPACLSVL